MYRHDYQQAGYLVLPRTVLRSKFLAWQSLVPSFALIAMSIVPRLLGFEGLAYTAGAFVLSIAFTYYAIKCVANKTNAGARLLVNGIDPASAADLSSDGS